MSRGGASAVMEAATTGDPALVLKNNHPYRVVIIVEDYEHMREVEEDKLLLSMALARLEDSGPIISEKYTLEALGIDEAELAGFDGAEVS